jgi:hypothetical protein
MSYPEKWLRGIANPDFLDSEGRLLASSFQFDDERPDGFCECSINWYDKEEALQLLMNQRKQDDEKTYQFKVGAAILSRSKLDNLIAGSNCIGALKYERAAIDGNPYHGNLLRKAGLIKQTSIMIASSIAMCVEKIKYRENTIDQ